ncbi:DUF4271 domain-containing protein [Sphingobacterium shayense]|nr:DUF4271 domain-containing protein [Sphingobacterium shayense]
MWIRIFLVGLFCCALNVAKSQELLHDVGGAVDSTVIDAFDYVFPNEDRRNKLLEHFLDRIQENSIDPIKVIENLKDASGEPEMFHGKLKYERPAWVLASVFFLFLALGVVRLLFPVDFVMIVQAFYNERTLQQISKEDNMLTSWPYIFLYLIFSLALGLFILLIESSFSHLEVLNGENYIRTTLLVAVLFVFKILLIRFVSVVFQLERLVREYIAVLYLVYFNSMLFLMPLLLVVTFAPASYFKFVLILFSVIAGILFIYRFLRTAFRLFGNLRFSVFYLILYLCALEVAPILILVKTLST